MTEKEKALKQFQRRHDAAKKRALLRFPKPGAKLRYRGTNQFWFTNIIANAERELHIGEIYTLANGNLLNVNRNLNMRNFYSLILTAIFAFIFSAGGTAVCAQEVISSTRTGTMTAAQINQRIKTVFGASAPIPATENVDLYKISYRSADENGRTVNLSGLIALPRGGAPKGLVVFNHGTIADRRASPSRFTGKADSSETELAILAFASGGYAVAIPDYLGLGDHQAAHPYPLAAVNSRSAVDIIAPARNLASRHKMSVGAQLFISGYSEGGAIGMWTVRDLEQKSSANYDVAAALASGPYDISGVTRNSLIAPTSNQATFVTRLYLISYMVNYFHKSRGVKLTDYFKPAMALTVSQAFKGNITDENIIKRLAFAAVLMRSKNSIDNVITARFKRAMETLDASDPVIRELQKQDVYDWKPRTKMLLINLKKDNVVDPANTDKAIAAMRRHGVGANSLRQYVIND